MTEGEAETKRQKAVEFLERIGGDAEKFRDMDAAEYAASRGAELLQNPRNRRMTMNGTTKTELESTLDELAEGLDQALDPSLSREELVDRVKELAVLASGEEEEEE